MFLKGKNGVTFFVGLLLAIALPLMYINKPSVIIITGGCSAKDLPISCSSSPDI